MAGEEFNDLEQAMRGLGPDQYRRELFHHKQHSLPSVCKAFRAVLEAYPGLYAGLFLVRDPKSTAVLRLHEHLQREDLKIRKLPAEDGNTSLDAATAMLTDPCSC